MPDREPSKLDRARAASAARDGRRKPAPENLLKDAAYYRRQRMYRRGGDCPDCGPGIGHRLNWDNSRELYVCERPLGCGGTWTVEELEYERSKLADAEGEDSAVD